MWAYNTSVSFFTATPKGGFLWGVQLKQHKALASLKRRAHMLLVEDSYSTNASVILRQPDGTMLHSKARIEAGARPSVSEVCSKNSPGWWGGRSRLKHAGRRKEQLARNSFGSFLWA